VPNWTVSRPASCDDGDTSNAPVALSGPAASLKLR
jgi:hypothetical protein